jgi:hypothetical protein
MFIRLLDKNTRKPVETVNVEQACLKQGKKFNENNAKNILTDYKKAFTVVMLDMSDTLFE